MLEQIEISPKILSSCRCLYAGSGYEFFSNFVVLIIWLMLQKGNYITTPCENDPAYDWPDNKPFSMGVFYPIIMASGIYKIQSKLKPNKIYIGSSVDFTQRKALHLSHLRSKTHHSPKLQRHYNKYGESDLVFTLFAICEKDELVPIDGIIRPEQFFLWAYNPYFNCQPIAGSSLGSKSSAETRKKISERLKGKKFSNEHRDNMSRPVFQYDLYGNLLYVFKSRREIEEHGISTKCISDACRGECNSYLGFIWTYDESSEIARARGLVELNRINRKKPVYQVNYSGEIVKEWESICDIEREAGLDTSSISGACLDRQKTSGGFIWSFTKKDIKEKVRRAWEVNRTVLQIDLNGNLIKKWADTKEPARYGYAHSSVFDRCSKHGKGKPYKGFVWVWERDYYFNNIQISF